ncbi:myosin-binding protein 3-like isoform X2 [Impatiens glandulifera]|uniref:myosin-binding protein 3-like isoform X2 n=1 Tax=Impatiens glandulifera TaxID=253017 RepID=UPI001FB0DEAC|nr:myosin-binding protein 3-like isoform X2 [Impatiens glandulifera]
MACQAIHSWTFAGLVGAFVNLTIAYFLLCASAVVYFASKFLGFLGLSLPCPCNGLQTLLIDCPKETVSSVMVSVKRSFPFNSIYQEDYSLNLRLISDGKNENVGVVQIDDGASSSLVTRRRNSRDSTGNGPFTPKRLEIGLGCDELGNDAPESGEISPYSSYIFSSTEMGSGWDQTHFIGKGGSIEDSDSDPGDDKVVHANPTMMEEKSECSCEEEQEDHDAELEMIKQIEEKEAIRILQRALEEERAHRAALYVELEKERIAASSAADEAMAMILRLQEEKALREMETRQYRRMVEERTAYEEEEMTILKEIIVSREREKHFLEKEVEVYREQSASAQIHEF